MEESIDSLRKRIARYVFQGVAIPTSGVGADQSPLLSRLFQSPDLATFFNTLFKTAIIVGAMFAVLRLGYAGYVYMTTDLWPQKQTSSRIIQDTVLGLLLLLGIWLILNQINPNLLDLNVLKNIRTQPVRNAPAGSQQAPNPALNSSALPDGAQTDSFFGAP